MTRVWKPDRSGSVRTHHPYGWEETTVALSKRFAVTITVAEVTMAPPVISVISGQQTARVVDTQDIVHTSTTADDPIVAIKRAMAVLDVALAELQAADVDTTAWNPDGGNRPVVPRERDYPTAADILDGTPGSGTADVTRKSGYNGRVTAGDNPKA